VLDLNVCNKSIRFILESVTLIVLLSCDLSLPRFSLLYPLSQPFEAVFHFVKQINDFLEKLITWPRELGVAIMNCHEKFPSPI
jgi:hypothetical protein